MKREKGYKSPKRKGKEKSKLKKEIKVQIKIGKSKLVEMKKKSFLRPRFYIRFSVEKKKSCY